MKAKIILDGTVEGVKNLTKKRKAMTYMFMGLTALFGYKSIQYANLTGRSSMVTDCLDVAENLTKEDEV